MGDDNVDANKMHLYPHCPVQDEMVMRFHPEQKAYITFWPENGDMEEYDANKMWIKYLGKKDAYIPAMGVLTKHTKDIVNKWKAALGSKKVSAQKCIKIAQDALDLVEIVHKKCMNLPEHIGKIQRNEIMQGQL